MYESPEDISGLQRLLDTPIEQAGLFLRESLELNRHAFTAHGLVDFRDGVRTASLATVTAKGEPRVAPVAAIFVRGKHYVPTVVNVARSRHLRQRPGVNLTEYAGHEDAIIVHGQATLVGIDHSEFEGIDSFYMAMTESGGPQNWGGGGPLYIRVDPDVMFATALGAPDNAG